MTIDLDRRHFVASSLATAVSGLGLMLPVTERSALAAAPLRLIAVGQATRDRDAARHRHHGSC